jgi:hypothetical protein
MRCSITGSVLKSLGIYGLLSGTSRLGGKYFSLKDQNGTAELDDQHIFRDGSTEKVNITFGETLI